MPRKTKAQKAAAKAKRKAARARRARPAQCLVKPAMAKSREHEVSQLWGLEPSCRPRRRRLLIRFSAWFAKQAIAHGRCLYSCRIAFRVIVDFLVGVRPVRMAEVAFVCARPAPNPRFGHGCQTLDGKPNTGWVGGGTGPQVLVYRLAPGRTQRAVTAVRVRYDSVSSSVSADRAVVFAPGGAAMRPLAVDLPGAAPQVTRLRIGNADEISDSRVAAAVADGDVRWRVLKTECDPPKPRQGAWQLIRVKAAKMPAGGRAAGSGKGWGHRQEAFGRLLEVQVTAIEARHPAAITHIQVD